MIGAGAFGDSKPMSRDAIYRSASLTKPTAAAMRLIEDGVYGWKTLWMSCCPNRQVLRSLDAELDDTVPAVRPITVNDVLTFRLGFGNIMAPPSTYPIQGAEKELQLASLGPP